MTTSINTINTTTINTLSHDGRGITTINGKITFVDGALPGEVVSFVYLHRYASFDEARVTAILQPSPQRITSATTSPSLSTSSCCNHFGICGGCSLQHLQHDAQLAFKQNVLLEQLEHIGGITVLPSNNTNNQNHQQSNLYCNTTEHKKSTNQKQSSHQKKLINTCKILPPLVGPIWNYRCKARLSVKYVQKKSKVLVGFHEKNGRFIVADMHHCPILHPSYSNKLGELSNLVTSLSNYQHIPQIELACGENPTKAAVVIRHLQKFTADDLTKLQQFAMENDCQIFLQPHGLDSVYCLTHEQEYLSYTLKCEEGTSNAIHLHFKPTDFTQINYHINQQMVARVLTLLDPQPNETILDLFCGIGNFTLPLARYCKHCVGVEGNESSIQRAIFNAASNRIDNVKFHCADLSKNTDAKGKNNSEKWMSLSYDKILLDPPRVGALHCMKQIIQLAQINGATARKIVYISCNPATLARDLKELIQQGYNLTHIGIMDMFPHTSHVEAIAVVEKV